VGSPRGTATPPPSLGQRVRGLPVLCDVAERWIARLEAAQPLRDASASILKLFEFWALSLWLLMVGEDDALSCREDVYALAAPVDGAPPSWWVPPPPCAFVRAPLTRCTLPK
jgi:hypothetical protein